MSEIDLNLVSTDELLEALKGRCQSLLVLREVYVIAPEDPEEIIIDSKIFTHIAPFWAEQTGSKYKARCDILCRAVHKAVLGGFEDDNDAGRF